MEVELTPEAFPEPFRTYVLLQKISTILTNYKVSKRELDYLFEHAAAVGWLDLNTLPPDSQAPSASFREWLRIVDLFLLREDLGQGRTGADESLQFGTTHWCVER